jgi:hypothetical protein
MRSYSGLILATALLALCGGQSQRAPSDLAEVPQEQPAIV